MSRPAILQNPIFTDNYKAREWLEARVWANGRAVAPIVGCVGNSTSLNGSKHRAGLYQCNITICREQFTVTVGTVFERSENTAQQVACGSFPYGRERRRAFPLIKSIARLGISYKSTWFMMHRLREAMRDGGLAPLGGAGSIVEVDESFIGGEKTASKSNKAKRNTKMRFSRSLSAAVPLVHSMWTKRRRRRSFRSFARRSCPRKPCHDR